MAHTLWSVLQRILELLLCIKLEDGLDGERCSFSSWSRSKTVYQQVSILSRQTFEGLRNLPEVTIPKHLPSFEP